MADFRRWFLAFAALVLVLGSAVPASAQHGLVCGASAAVAPTLRHEGFTELVGDILLTCTGAPGSTATPLGTPVAQANITVNVGAPITSRVLTAPVTEALLLVDDPSPSNQDPCLNPINPAIACQVLGDGVGGSFNTSTKYNVFQGITGLGGPGPSATTITFLGVPVDPPATPGWVRTYRITNIRVDATGIGVGVPLEAYVTSSSSTSINITAQQAQAVVGFATLGLQQDITGQPPVVATVTPAASFLECFGSPMVQVGTATFTEAFASAFKIKTQLSGPQNTPGIVYNSESGLEVSINDQTTGIADTGTRLMIEINNVPPGAVVYVDNWAQSTAAVGPCSGEGLTYTCALLSDATLVPSNNSSPLDAGGNTITKVIDNSTGSANASGTVVWEVTNANPVAIDSLVFRIWASFAGQSSNTSLSTTTTGVGGFSPQATSAVAGESIPTFSSTVPGLPSPGPTLFTTAPCETYLLFPYVTDFTGFDTGVAISNTSLDSLNTTAQNTGSCSISFYSSGALAFTTTTPVITGGTTWASTLSGLDPAWSTGTPSVPMGYAIATCDFQYAHGYSFVSDYGLEHFAAAYLALVIPDVASGRAALPFVCASQYCYSGPTGEQLVH